MEIIPKPKKREFPLEVIFLYLSIFIFVATVIFSFNLWSKERAKKREISQIEEKISSLKTPEVKKAEEEVLKYQEKILDFSKIIEDHLLLSKIFPYLEQKTHKKIYFSKMDLDSEKSTIFLSGQSPDFYVLAQQLEILKSDPSLKVQLKEANLGKEGKVDFKIEITFDKSILK
jgi:hypothetical protein